MTFEGFTVSYSGEEHVCLSSDERLWVQDFKVESHQVNTHTHTHFFVFIFLIKTIEIDIQRPH